MRQLHQTGRQLAVLRRMYESYALIIERILDRQKLADKFRGHRVQSPPQSPQANTSKNPIDAKPSLAPLTSKAKDKFERLKDRIELYALSEIEECQKEKEELTFLVSNQ